MEFQPSAGVLQLSPRSDRVARLRSVSRRCEVVQAAQQVVLPQPEPLLERHRRRDELAPLELLFRTP